MFTRLLDARKFTAILISAMLALPNPSWAASEDNVSGDATDGIPVILQPIQTKDGRTAYLAIAPIPVEAETEFVSETVKRDAKHTVLVVSGPNDPALRAALNTGELQDLKTFVATSAEEAPLANSPEVKASLKSKFVGAVNKVTSFLKNKQKQYALGMSMYVGGVYGSFTYIESSSVASGLSVFGAIMAWAGFQTAFTHQWEKVLEKSGDVAVEVFSAAARLIGKELSPASKRMFATAGSFNTVWAINSAMVSWVFVNAGTFESILASVLYGYAVSYDIYDKDIARRVKLGELGVKWLTTFVALRVFVGTIFEVLSFSHVPHMQLGLTVLTTGGVVWLGIGPKAQNKIIGKLGRFKKGCENLLKKVTGEGL